MAFLPVLAAILTLLMCGSTTVSSGLVSAEVKELKHELQDILAMEQQLYQENKKQYEEMVAIQSAMTVLTTALNSAFDEFRDDIGTRSVCSLLTEAWNSIEGGRFITQGNKIILRARSGSVVNLNEIVPIKGFDLDLTNAKYDCSKNTFAISAILKSTTTIIPNFMVVSQVAIAVEADLTDIAKTLSTTLQGVWAVGKLKIDVTLTYSRSSGATSVTATPASGTKIKSFIKNVLGISLPVSPTVNLAFIFRGDIFRDGFTTLSVTYDKGDNNYYGIYQKRGDSAKSAKGIATDIQHIQLSKAIKNVINIDISGAPYFGSLSVSNLDLTYATELITNLNQGALGESSLLQKLGYQIEEGLTAYVNVPFHSDALILTYRSKTLSLTTPERNLRLDNLLSYLISGDSDWKSKLPSQLSGIFSINIESITVMADKLAVNLAYPGELVFAEGILSISDVKVETVVAKSSPKATANVFGVIKIGGINFNTQLVQNDEGKYVLTASAGTLKISSYIDSLQAAVLPDSISKFLSKIPFLNFDLQNPKMSYTYGVTPLEVQLGGTPVIQGFTVANLECLVVKSTGVGSKTNVILGFQLGKLDLASLLEKVTTFDFGGVFPLLKQTVDAIVTISPITSTTTHFTIGELASMPVTAGVSVTASMVFPKDCSSKDYFCIYAGRLIGSDVALNIKATFSSSGSFPLFASIGNLKIDKLTLQRAGLEIIGGKSSQIGLVGQVQLEKPPLLFTAGISAGTNGLTLRLSVAGCWIKAFDVEWLTLCKFIGSISFAPPTGITGLSLGAEIHLGYPDSGHQLKAQGYMGVSIINPLENYYYVSFTKLTMGPLLQAFNIRFTLPKPLADSGFPQGFSSSFSVSGQEIQDLGVIIPAGYRINGTINILGLQATADIVIDLPNKIDISVALPPINVGNLLTMYASKTDKNNGPFLKAEVQLLPNQNVDIEAQGYLNVLGISLEAMLKITNTEYEYSVRGKVFSLFQARMTVKASYGSIKSASFQVKGEFELDLFKTIEQVCQQLFKSQGNEAKTAFNEAKSEVDKYVRLQKQARQTFDKAKNALNNAKKGIFMAKVMKSCSSRRCMNVANQGWKRKVRRAARRTTRSVSRSVSRTVDDVVDVGKDAINAAQKTYNNAKNELDKYNRLLGEANAVFGDVLQIFKSGLKVFDYIAKFATGSVISIKKIWFDVSLKTASGGNFAGGIELNFLGENSLKTGVSFNIRDTSKLAENVFEEVVAKMDGLF